jgi:predicted RNA binding protein YcfA (HicA-like mRNA interferase family)
MSALQYALDLAAKGRVMVPAHPQTKRPPFKEWQHQASKDPDKLREWFGRSYMLPAALCGEPSGIVVLDVESKNSGLEWLDQHRDRLPETEEYETRSGGHHLVFRHQDGQRTIPLGKIHPGVELRAAGALAIYWPAGGFPRLSDAPVADLPAWVLPKPENRHERLPVAPRVTDDASLGRMLRFASEAPSGERNRRLYWAGCRLAEQVNLGTMSAGYAIALIEAAGMQAGLPRHEARATAQSAIQGGRA